MGIAIYGRPEETRVENFLGDVVRAMMSLSGTMVASFKNIHSFLPVHTPLDNLIGTNPKEIGEIIVNGDSPPPMRTVDGIKQTYPPTTAEEKLARKNKLKSRDLNMKLLRSLPSKWKTHTPIWRNKPDLETLSMDDLYNNLKIYETKVKGSSSSSQNSQNVAFVSSNSSGSINQAHGFNFANTDSLSDAMVMLNKRARRFLKKNGIKIGANGSETIGFDKTKVECYNCHKRGHFTRKCRATRENRYIELVRRNVIIETIDANALMAQERFGYDWSDQAEDGPTNLALMTYTSLEHYDNLSKDYKKYQFNVGAYKTDLGSVEARLVVYKKSKEIFEDNIKILKLDIYLRDNALTKLRKKLEKAEKERDEIKITLEKFENSSKTLNKIEDENETETKSKQRKPSFAKIEFAKHNEQMKSHRESVKQEEHNRQAKHPRKNNQSPRVENADFVEIVDFINANLIKYALTMRLSMRRGETNRVERAATTAASLDAEQDSGDRPAQTRFKRLSKQSYEPPLSRVNTLGSGEDNMQLMELMELCTKLSAKVLALKNNKTAQDLKFTHLKKREDASNQGRNDQDKEISFVQDAEIQGRYSYDIENNTASTSITTASINIITVEPVNTVNTPITTAGVSVSTAEPKKGSKEKSSETATRPTRGVIMREASETTTRPTVPPQQKLDPKDKEEEERMAKQKEEDANISEWDDVQAMMDADHELAERLQAEEQG
nr:hypothetical protein [Tanacetum cinerariifolium]